MISLPHFYCMTKEEHISYLGQLAQLLKIEREEDWKRFQVILKEQPVAERVREGLTWFPLKINEQGFGLGAYPFLVVEKTKGPARHQFQNGQPVELFSLHEDYSNEAVRGVVEYVDDARMKIHFRMDELPDWVDEGRIGVNVSFDEKTYNEMFLALNEVINADKSELSRLRDALTRQESNYEIANEFTPLVHLNHSQNEAVRAVLDSEDWTIVHGPPGTGKTTTLVEAVKLLAARGEKILCTATTNAAVDHVVDSMVKKGMRVVRIGNAMKIQAHVKDVSLESLLYDSPDYQKVKDWKRKANELRKLGGKYKRNFGREEAEQRKLIFREAKEMMREARDTESYLIEKILDQAEVICATLVGSTHEMLRSRIFDTVVIDEAAQAIEPATWIPIRRAKKVVLAGDPFQLPATLFSQEAIKLGLSVSLMERLVASHKNVHLLSVQYRMNDTIMSFSNAEFYENKLASFEANASHNLFQGDAAVEFIDTAGTGWNEEEGEGNSSLKNSGEAGLVFKHYSQLKELSSVGFRAAIISPYRGQIAELEKHFAFEEGVKLNTVDAFQGQEADVVYISLVRSNEAGDIGFLKDYRRMNVAMTRAKKKLVVIGDSSTIGNDAFYGRFLTWVESQNAYQSAWTWMS